MFHKHSKYFIRETLEEDFESMQLQLFIGKNPVV